jgi:hypothetical protein
VENEYGVWGVALEDIHPDGVGRVQVTGAVMIHNVQGDLERDDYSGGYGTDGDGKRVIKNRFIFAGKDGQYHLGQRGRAEVIWHCSRSGWTLALLGCQRESFYTGMFAVIENGDGTLTVKGGATDLTDNAHSAIGTASQYYVDDTVLNIEDRDGRIILLQATFNTDFFHSWDHKIVSVKDIREDNYIPGKKIYWEIARYTSVDKFGYIQGFEQLWQGGMINFRDRYYIER